MPGGDRTGPLGRGPMTGRALGYCAGNNRPGYANPGFGRGWVGHIRLGGNTDDEVSLCIVDIVALHTVHVVGTGRQGLLATEEEATSTDCQGKFVSCFHLSLRFVFIGSPWPCKGKGSLFAPKKNNRSNLANCSGVANVFLLV